MRGRAFTLAKINWTWESHVRISSAPSYPPANSPIVSSSSYNYPASDILVLLSPAEEESIVYCRITMTVVKVVGQIEWWRLTSEWMMVQGVEYVDLKNERNLITQILPQPILCLGKTNWVMNSISSIMTSKRHDRHYIITVGDDNSNTTGKERHRRHWLTN